MRIVKPNKFSLVERWEVTGKLSGPWRCWSSCLEYKLSLQWWRINAVLCNGGKILNWSYLSVQSVSRLGTRIEGSCNTKLPASSTRCRRCWTRTWLTRRDSSPAGSCTRPHFPPTTRTAAPACPPPPTWRRTFHCSEIIAEIDDCSIWGNDCLGNTFTMQGTSVPITGNHWYCSPQHTSTSFR